MTSMYRAYYGFRERPFSKTPDPRFLYLSRGHREALARLEYVVEERETALLTGEIGCGKTTLSRALMDAVGDDYRFCFIFNPRLSPLEFLRQIARELKVKTPSTRKDELLGQIHHALYQLSREGKSAVLVIDEAQLIPDREMFDELRLLTNFQLDDQNLMSMILMGQPELREILSHPSLEAFRQRISLHHHLTPLTLPEVQEYLDTRLVVAGGSPGLFTPDAVARIHQLSGGIPRRINQIATNALLVGFGMDATVIEAGILEEMERELDVMSTPKDLVSSDGGARR